MSATSSASANTGSSSTAMPQAGNLKMELKDIQKSLIGAQGWAQAPNAWLPIANSVQFSEWKKVHEMVVTLLKSDDMKFQDAKQCHTALALLTLQFGALAKVTSITCSRKQTNPPRYSIDRLNLAPVELSKDPFAPNNGYFRSDFTTHELTQRAVASVTGFLKDKVKLDLKGMSACVIQKGAGKLFDGWKVTWKEKISNDPIKHILHTREIKCVQQINDVKDCETPGICNIWIGAIPSPIRGEFEEFPIAVFPTSCSGTVMNQLINFGAAPTLEKISAACATFFAWAPKEDRTLLPRLFNPNNGTCENLRRNICEEANQIKIQGNFDNLDILNNNILTLSKVLTEKLPNCAEFIKNHIQYPCKWFADLSPVEKLNLLDSLMIRIKALIFLNGDKELSLDFNEIEKTAWKVRLSPKAVGFNQKNIFTASGTNSLAIVLHALKECVSGQWMYRLVRGEFPGYFEFSELVEYAKNGWSCVSDEEVVLQIGDIIPSIDIEIKNSSRYTSLCELDFTIQKLPSGRSIVRPRQPKQPLSKPQTIILDITSGGKLVTERLIKEYTKLIEDGDLNLVFIESAQKFRFCGFDDGTGGVISIFNNNKDKWGAFNRSVDSCAITKGYSHDIVSLWSLKDPEQPEMLHERYQNHIAKQTIAAYNAINKDILVPNDGSCQVFIHIRLPSEQKLEPKERDQEWAILAQNIHAQFENQMIESRGSFGFQVSSIKQLPYHEAFDGLQMRLTVGLCDDSAWLSEFFNNTRVSREQQPPVISMGQSNDGVGTLVQEKQGAIPVVSSTTTSNSQSNDEARLAHLLKEQKNNPTTQNSQSNNKPEVQLPKQEEPKRTYASISKIPPRTNRSSVLSVSGSISSNNTPPNDESPKPGQNSNVDNQVDGQKWLQELVEAISKETAQ